MRRAFIAISITVAFRVDGAATLKGKLVRNEIGGPPVVGAAVGANGANQTKSVELGGFTLVFPGKSPGDVIELSVSRQGMVVVNWVQLTMTLPSDPDSNRLTLILAREAEREEMARRFFRLKSEEEIRATFENRLYREGEQHRARLQRERDEAIANVGRMAEELAKIRPGQASELYVKAMRLFGEGKVDEAISELNESKLKEIGREAQKQLTDAVQAWRLRGRLLTTKLQFADAEKSYAAAVQIAPGDFDACFEHSYFLASLNRHQAGTAGYRRCLEIARMQSDRVGVALTLNNLGNLHRDQNRMEEAGKAYEEALGIRRTLARGNPDTYLPDVAMTLNNLGVLHRAQNRMEEAGKAYEEALGTYRTLARTNPETYLPYVARVLWNVGRMHAAVNRRVEARANLQEALGIYETFAKRDPAQYEPFVEQVRADLAKVDGTP